MTTTDQGGVQGGERSGLGYWPLAPGAGRPHVHRTDLAPAPLGSTDAARDTGRTDHRGLGEPLLTVAHLSDLHVCDAQSPARAEFLDRWADPDSPLKPLIDAVGSYRAQELLTVQVADAMVRAANSVTAGPVGGAPVDWAIITGDVVDSAQANELAWYLALLDGGRVTPDSGSPDRYEGVADRVVADEYFWHPQPDRDGRPPDRPRLLFGFPDAPGLLDAVRRPFEAGGLRMPWLAVHGNHDQLVQGTVPATGGFPRAGLETRKVIGVPASWSLEEIGRFCAGVDGNRDEALRRWPELPTRQITADLLRDAITRPEFVAAHLHGTARPAGHGFPADAAETGRAYYRYDHIGPTGSTASNGPAGSAGAPDRAVTVLVLDTVNEHGGWQGSLDEAQLAWLDLQLAGADGDGRYVVLASHHTLADLVNDTTTDGADRRVLAAELDAVVDRHRSVVLWLNGHTHITSVRAHRGGHPWWEVTAPSLIDFPQQGRVVELLRGRGTLTVAATMLDHTGELPWSGSVHTVDAMAGLSRQLAANAWQQRVDDLDRHPRAGRQDERNVLLHLPDPFA